MMNPRAVAHILRPLSEPLPLDLQQRGCKVLETLNGLDGKDQLEVACRTVLAVLMAAQPRFQGENELIFNDPCAAVLHLRGGPPVVKAGDEAAAFRSASVRYGGGASSGVWETGAARR